MGSDPIMFWPPPKIKVDRVGHATFLKMIDDAAANPVRTLRTTVSPGTHSKFLQLCKQEGRSPDAVQAQLIQNYVKSLGTCV